MALGVQTLPNLGEEHLFDLSQVRPTKTATQQTLNKGNLTCLALTSTFTNYDMSAST